MEILLDLFIASIIFNVVLFIPAYIFQTDKLTDIGYALTFLFVGLYPLLTGYFSDVYMVAYLVVVLWAFRLGIYLLYRISKMKKDSRFDVMRKKFFSFLGFWLLQGVTVFAVSVGFTRVALINTNFELLSLTGIFLSLVGLTIETVADIQKFHFKQNPNNKGKWTNLGLWKYARHPNYFGEMLVWWGLFIYGAFYLDLLGIAISAVSPIFITFMLLFVSGIPLLRKRWEKKWGNDPKFKQYVKETRLLLPLPK
jgi:steroid 5-alpha reductase family enzyme